MGEQGLIPEATQPCAEARSGIALQSASAAKHAGKTLSRCSCDKQLISTRRHGSLSLNLFLGIAHWCSFPLSDTEKRDGPAKSCGENPVDGGQISAREQKVRSFLSFL